MVVLLLINSIETLGRQFHHSKPGICIGKLTGTALGSAAEPAKSTAPRPEPTFTVALKPAQARTCRLLGGSAKTSQHELFNSIGSDCGIN